MQHRVKCPFHNSVLTHNKSGHWDEENGNVTIDIWQCETCLYNYAWQHNGWVYVSFDHFSNEISELTYECPILHAKEKFIDFDRDELVEIIYNTDNTLLNLFKRSSKLYGRKLTDALILNDIQELNLIDMSYFHGFLRELRLKPFF